MGCVAVTTAVVIVFLTPPPKMVSREFNAPINVKPTGGGGGAGLGGGFDFLFC